MMLNIRPATPADVAFVASRLRLEDEMEVRAATGRDPEEVLPQTCAAADPLRCFVIRLAGGSRAGVPCGLFGVSDDRTAPGWGAVWLLGTPELRLGAGALLEEGQYWVQYFRSVYPEGIHNYVYIRNATHLRWCERLGFSFGARYVFRGAYVFQHIFMRGANTNVFTSGRADGGVRCASDGRRHHAESGSGTSQSGECAGG